jgi:TetR/AcrR family transcriptional repressor of bet genes
VGRPSNTRERRAQILEGFLDVLAREGYAQATIARTAGAAGLAPGLVHYHFHDKHELLVTLAASLGEALERRLAARLARAGADPRRRLGACVDAYLARGRDADPRAVAAWVVLGAEAVREADVRAIYAATARAGLERLTRLVAEALAAEGRPPRAARRIAIAALTMIEGAYRVSAAAPGLCAAGFAAPTVRAALAAMLDAEARA